MINERPSRYLYRAASSRQRYPCWPVWYRERHPIKKHYRVLDCEDVYDSDDFYKVEFNVRSDPAYTQYVSPSEYQRFQYQRRARLRAEAIVANIEAFKQNAINRKRLLHAKNEFDFVFEPYRQKLKKEYGRGWRWEMQKRRSALYEKVWREMRRLAWIVQQREIAQELNKQAKERREDYAAAHAAHLKQRSEFAVRISRPVYQGPLRGMTGYYGPAERASDLAKIERGMKWIDGFENPYFTRIVVKIMDEQKDIRDQVKLIERIEATAKAGQLQPLLEELNRRAGLYAA